MNSDVVLPKWDDVLKGSYLYTAMGHERMRYVETYARACVEADRKVRPDGGERVAQLIAHRACCGVEHDPENGKLHGYCVVCGVPWPCEYAGTPSIHPAPADVARLVDADQEYDKACLALNCETVTEDDKRNEHWARYHAAKARRAESLAPFTTDKQRGSDGESVPDVQVRGVSDRVRELLLDRHNRLMNSFGGTPYEDGRVQQQIDAIEAQMAAHHSACELGAVRELADQLRGELLHTSPMWEATSYERGRISEKGRCISLLDAIARPQQAALQQRGDSPEVGRG